MKNLEALTNAVTGIAIAQLVLWLFGVPLSHAISMNLVLFSTSWGRSFALRMLFSRWARDG